jgi:hypothetical protein
VLARRHELLHLSILIEIVIHCFNCDNFGCGGVHHSVQSHGASGRLPFDRLRTVRPPIGGGAFAVPSRISGVESAVFQGSE